MADRGFGKQFQRRIIQDFTPLVSSPEQAAMAVRSVFAQTDVGDDLKFRPAFFQHGNGALHDPVRSVGLACLRILVLWNAKKHQRPETMLHRRANPRFKAREGKLMLARHGSDFLTKIHIGRIHDEIWHDQIFGGQSGFPHHSPKPWRAPQSAPAKKIGLHVLILICYACAAPPSSRISSSVR